jgi:hypothetical protein
MRMTANMDITDPFRNRLSYTDVLVWVFPSFFMCSFMSRGSIHMPGRRSSWRALIVNRKDYFILYAMTIFLGVVFVNTTYVPTGKKHIMLFCFYRTDEIPARTIRCCIESLCGEGEILLFDSNVILFLIFKKIPCHSQLGHYINPYDILGRKVVVECRIQRNRSLRAFGSMRDSNMFRNGMKFRINLYT